jgi:hypothetical protein
LNEKKKEANIKNTWRPNDDKHRLGPFCVRCGPFPSFSGEVAIGGALGVRVDKEVVVVEGGEREDGGVGVDSVVVDGRHDDVYSWLHDEHVHFPFGKHREGT